MGGISSHLAAVASTDSVAHQSETSMKQWQNPRTLGAGALVAFILGIGLLYAGFFRLAPVALLIFVLLTVLSMIALTVADIQQLIVRQNDSAAPSDTP
jgi:DMSO reductase anchor subunit